MEAMIAVWKECSSVLSGFFLRCCSCFKVKVFLNHPHTAWTPSMTLFFVIFDGCCFSWSPCGSQTIEVTWDWTETHKVGNDCRLPAVSQRPSADKGFTFISPRAFLRIFKSFKSAVFCNCHPHRWWKTSSWEHVKLLYKMAGSNWNCASVAAN